MGYGQSTTIYSDTQVVNWANWQEDYIISMILASSQTVAPIKTQEMKDKLQKLFDALEKEKQKKVSEYKLLQIVFNYLFDNQLYKYKALTTFDKTIAQKEFDCLTGTLLFTLVLEKLGFRYAIHETNYHVYLTVITQEGEVLIETTDRQFGLQKNKYLIAKKIHEYKRQYEKAKEENKNAYTSLLQIDRQIDLIQLVGLHYFNQAVNAYNQKDFEKAIKILKQSMQLYDADRSAELMILAINQYLQQPHLEGTAKEKLLQYQDFYAHKLAQKIRH